MVFLWFSYGFPMVFKTPDSHPNPPGQLSQFIADVGRTALRVAVTDAWENFGDPAVEDMEETAAFWFHRIG